MTYPSIPSTRRLWQVVGSAVAAVALGAVPAAGAVLQADADTYLRDATPRGGLTFMDIRGGGVDFGGYLRFDLSGLNIDEVTDATLTVHVAPDSASRNDIANTDRFALHGLNNVAGNTPQNWDEATLSEGGANSVGAEWVSSGASLQNVTDLDGDVPGITETRTGANLANTGTFTITGAPLVAFLQGRVDDGGLATFIIVNPDGTDRGYGLGTKEHLIASLHPVLDVTFTAIPEPAAISVVGLAAVGLLARRRRRA